MKLTPAREIYCQARFRGLSQRKAYLEAYPGSKEWKDRTVDKRACELEKEGNVLGRLEELKGSVATSNILTEIELQEFWTSIVKQENEDDKIFVEMKDRLKASELLGRNKKMFVDKVEHSGKMPNIILNK